MQFNFINVFGIYYIDISILLLMLVQYTYKADIYLVNITNESSEC